MANSQTNIVQAVVLIKIPYLLLSISQEPRNRRIRLYQIELWSRGLVGHQLGTRRGIIEMDPICVQSIRFRRNLVEVDSKNPESRSVIIPYDTILERYEEDNNFDPFAICANDLMEIAVLVKRRLLRPQDA